MQIALKRCIWTVVCGSLIFKTQISGGQKGC